ncbi:organelle RRM domain-containing protein 2, mitochondrial-like isoform X2 [Silene latifolia]|uniref:organelle RRM domain-containing protein 2, mitochondrial-like isoform X2 n=1 Tax=Silene latifolia TaxID=37657 RepID=UPI003D7879C2
MAMKAAVMAAMSATKPRGLNRLCTTLAFNFTPPQPSSQQPAAPVADPSPNLYVCGLNKRTTTDGLHEAFSKFGEVVHAKVVTDHVSGFSKGFGFVKYATTEEAKSGIEGMNGAFLDGWVIFAEFAKPRPAPAYQQQNGSPPFGKRGY